MHWEMVRIDGTTGWADGLAVLVTMRDGEWEDAEWLNPDGRLERVDSNSAWKDESAKRFELWEKAWEQFAATHLSLFGGMTPDNAREEIATNPEYMADHYEVFEGLMK